MINKKFMRTLSLSYSICPISRRFSWVARQNPRNLAAKNCMLIQPILAMTVLAGLPIRLGRTDNSFSVGFAELNQDGESWNEV